MSYKLIEKVLAESRADDAAERLLLVVLAFYVNQDQDYDAERGEGRCWPSNETITARMKLKLRQIQYIKAKLVTLGELAIIERRGRSMIYVIRPGYSQPETEKSTEQKSQPDNEEPDESNRPSSFSLKADNAKTPTEPGSRDRRRRPIPLDFALTAELRSYCAAHGVDPEFAIQEFKTYWLGDGGLKRDWAATFRNRVLQLSKRSNNGRRAPHTAATSMDAAREVLRETRERFANQNQTQLEEKS